MAVYDVENLYINSAQVCVYHCLPESVDILWLLLCCECYEFDKLLIDL